MNLPIKKLLLGLLLFVLAVAQENDPPKLTGPYDIAGALYKCGAIDGNIGLARVLIQAADLPNKPSWNRAVRRLENDRSAAHCEQYMRAYSVERGEWKFASPGPGLN